MVCLACRCSFTNREDQVFPGFVFKSISKSSTWELAFPLVCQMEHYKLDWHRFNLKQKMLGASPVSAEEFEKKTGAGEEKQHSAHFWGLQQESSQRLCGMLEQLFDFPVFNLQETCQVSQDRSLIATSLRQIMRLCVKAMKGRAGPPPRSFSRTQQDSICQCIAASCRTNLLRYEDGTVPSVLTELNLLFFLLHLSQMMSKMQHHP